jgi:NADH-quinone oxidoreductase subunit N
MPPTSVPLPIVTPQDLVLGLTLLAPLLVVIVTAIVVLVIDLIITDWVSRRPLMWIAALGLLLGIATCGVLWQAGYVGQTAFGGFLVLDGFALFFEAVFLLTAMLVILSATTFADRDQLIETEFYVMVLFSTSGLMLMASGNELMTIYLALEVTSLSLAFLAAWNKRDAIAGQGLRSTEAGIKFFLLSAMSTAVCCCTAWPCCTGFLAPRPWSTSRAF